MFNWFGVDKIKRREEKYVEDHKYYKKLLIEGNLPADFDQWELSDGLENLAEYAAKNGLLPEGFDEWDLSAKYGGYLIAHIAAQYGTLPSGFNKWHIPDKHGTPVAFHAVWYNHLPKDFNAWRIHNNIGETVAHAAAVCQNLPENFDQWQLQNLQGMTVAHIYVNNGGDFPPDSPMWLWVNTDGVTVASMADCNETSNAPKIANRCEILNSFPSISFSDINYIYSKLENFKGSAHHTDDHITVTLDHHLNHKQIKELNALYKTARWEKLEIHNHVGSYQCSISFYF